MYFHYCRPYQMKHSSPSSNASYLIKQHTNAAMCQQTSYIHRKVMNPIKTRCTWNDDQVDPPHLYQPVAKTGTYLVDQRAGVSSYPTAKLNIPSRHSLCSSTRHQSTAQCYKSTERAVYYQAKACDFFFRRSTDTILGCCSEQLRLSTKRQLLMSVCSEHSTAILPMRVIFSPSRHPTVITSG